MTAVESTPLTGSLGLYLVQREFTGDGVVRVPGEVVDATGWANIERLAAIGYVAAFNGTAVEKDGRLWLNPANAPRRTRTRSKG